MERVAAVYLLGGIALDSELPLPELPRQAAGAGACVWPVVKVHVGKVPMTLPGAAEADPDCFATPSEYLLRVPGVARYLVSHGTRIVIEPAEGSLPLDVRAFLLGTVFAVLGHQRGLLPLHASAVDSAEGVAAFLAPSGQGKSSLAAHLAERGFRVIADDVCMVDAGPEREAMVIPSTPWLKLWRASLQELGRPTEGLEQVFSEDDKYRLPLEDAPNGLFERRPIRQLLFLDREESIDGRDSEVRIEEVTSVRALPLLMNLTHQAYLLEAMGKREQNFRQCGQVLSKARAYRLIRPWGFRHMAATIDKIESFLHEDQPSG